MMKAIIAGSLLALSCGVAHAEDAAPGPILFKGTGINVSDLEVSAKFYTETLGLKVASVVPPGPIKGAKEVVLSASGVFDLGDTTLIALQHIDDRPLPPDHARFGRLMFMGRDITGIAARAKARGSQVREVPYGVYFTDPDGYSLKVTNPDMPMTLPKPKP